MKENRRQKRKRKLLEQQNGTCFYCGSQIKPEHETIDHLTPKTAGGVGTRSNLVLCCRYINELFGDIFKKKKLEWKQHHYGIYRCRQAVGQSNTQSNSIACKKREE